MPFYFLGCILELRSEFWYTLNVCLTINSIHWQFKPHSFAIVFFITFGINSIFPTILHIDINKMSILRLLHV
jgi:hypothetical protein